MAVPIIITLITVYLSHRVFKKELKLEKTENYKYEKLPKVMSNLYDFITNILSIDVHQLHNPKEVDKIQNLVESLDENNLKHMVDRKFEVLNEIEELIRSFKLNNMKDIIVSCNQDSINYFLRLTELMDLVNKEFNENKGISGPTLDNVYKKIIFMCVVYAIEGLNKLNVELRNQEIDIYKLEQILINNVDMELYMKQKYYWLKIKLFL